MKLHLGCGHRLLDGFVNVDIEPGVGADETLDITNLEPFDDNSVDLIYACHVLEHIRRPVVLDTLREWRRVLRPGGTLRLSVPDFQILASLYIDDGVSLWRLIGPLCGRQNGEWNTHYSVYDKDYLSWLLTEAGFYHVRRWFPTSDHPEGWDDYSLATIDSCYISLNLEATA